MQSNRGKKRVTNGQSESRRNPLIRTAEDRDERGCGGIRGESRSHCFLEYSKDFPDHRQPGTVIYLLNEILVLSLFAVLAGAESFADIARFGEKKLELLRRLRPICGGATSHKGRLGGNRGGRQPGTKRRGLKKSPPVAAALN